MSAISAEHLEGMNRIRHYLAHATMGLQAHEAAARVALGEEMYASLAKCLERSRSAIDDWLKG